MRRPAAVLGILLIVFIFLQWLLPLRTAVQIGADEGFELAKATLCLKGYQLYSEVWNDQPPLHTVLITQILKHLSPSILGPRLLTTGFTALLLASVFFMAVRVSGLLAATLATAMLIASPTFLQLSASCMLEIPALAMAVAALAVLLGMAHETPASAKATAGRHETPAYAEASAFAEAPADRTAGRHEKMAIAAAGTLFGVALLIKLVPIILLPLAGLALGLYGFNRRDHKERRAAKPQIRNPKSEIRNKFKNARSTKSEKTGMTGARDFLAACEQFRLEHCKDPAAGGLGRDVGHALFVFGGSMAITWVALDFAIERGAFLRHLGQTWTSHFAPARSFEYGSAADHPFDWSVLLKNWDVTFPAILGVIILLARFRDRKSAMNSPTINYELIPPAWLALSLLVFGMHKPWWSYYYVHTSIPLCWCAGIGVAALTQSALRPRPRNRSGFEDDPPPSRRGTLARQGDEDEDEKALGLGFLRKEVGHGPDRSGSYSTRPYRIWFAVLIPYGLCALAWMGGRLWVEVRTVRDSPQTYNTLVLAEMARFKPVAEWLYTDEPIYSFHSGIPLPPDLAVVMLKRLWSGDMTNARIAAEVESYMPGLILLHNDARPVPFQNLLQHDYRLVYMDADHRLYAKRLAKPEGRRAKQS